MTLRPTFRQVLAVTAIYAVLAIFASMVPVPTVDDNAATRVQEAITTYTPPRIDPLREEDIIP